MSPLDAILRSAAIAIHRNRCITTDDQGPCETITEVDLGIATTVFDAVLADLQRGLTAAYRRVGQQIADGQDS